MPRKLKIRGTHGGRRAEGYIWRSVEIYRPFRTVDMKQLQGARGEIPPRATPVKHRWIAGYICVHAIIVAQPGATFTTR